MVMGAWCGVVTDWEQYEVELFSCDFYFYGGGHGGGHGGGYGGGSLGSGTACIVSVPLL